jgi:hypothetical protein
MLVDWSQRIFALQHGVDVSHCQLFESNVTTNISNWVIRGHGILTCPEFLQRCAMSD